MLPSASVSVGAGVYEELASGSTLLCGKTGAVAVAVVFSVSVTAALVLVTSSTSSVFGTSGLGLLFDMVSTITTTK